MWISLSSYCLEFVEYLVCLYSCLLSKLNHLQPLFLPITSLPQSLSSGCPTVCMLVHSMVHYCFLRFCLRQSFFFLFPRLNNIYCSIVIFVGSFFCCFKSAIESLMDFSFHLFIFSAPDFLLGSVVFRMSIYKAVDLKCCSSKSTN